MERRWIVRTGADLGAAVAQIRQERGLTQAQAAADAGLSRHWLAKLEGGRSAVVLEHLLRTLRRLGATVTVTFEPADDAPPATATDPPRNDHV